MVQVPGRSRRSHEANSRRRLFLETLEDRRLLTAVRQVDATEAIHAPHWPAVCEPLTVAPMEIGGPGSLVATRELGPLKIYGPLLPGQRIGNGYDLFAPDRDWQVAADLEPPEMTGISSLSSDIAAAILAAWELPPDTYAGSWVIGLSPGTIPSDLATLDFETSVATPYLPNTYVLQLAAPTSVFDAGQEIAAYDTVDFFYPLISRQHATRSVPNDPLFGSQWHLRNTGQSGGTPGADANVVDAWDSYTGSGVVIGIVDDGLQHAHPDLTTNYDASLSYDFNYNDSDPSPAFGDSHGTSCAGVAAARGDNGRGVSGAAPEASLAGLRLIAAATTDMQEAAALSYQDQSIDIYSNSWGPWDDGTVQGAGPLTLAAIADGVVNGRSGLGNIYTWAAGNGLESNDNVNYDGYANSRYTIAVAAVDHNGVQSYYSEPGAPILVTAYSSGTASGIVTTTLMGSGNLQDPAGSYDYRSDFGGTSSATPLVSGVVALMLDANPNLTWRDVQHVLVNSAAQNHPADSDWVTNGAGHLLNHKYGFGVIDAEAAVALASSWTNVAPQISASSGLVAVNTAIPDSNTTGITSSITLPDALQIEHVEVVLNATHAFRGDLEIVLTSPAGTESILAQQRADDGDNYNSWVFTSVRHWDESSSGNWTLRIADTETQFAGTFNSWQLNVYGTPLGDDYGDAPDDPYGTLASSDGPRHSLGGPFLGAAADAEEDGQPTAGATGDGADEDGVIFGDPLVAGTVTAVRMTSSNAGGSLDYFVDFDGTGGFANQANEAFTDLLSGGVQTIQVAVPGEAPSGSTFARFRISSAGGLGPLGLADDGEVEDYAVSIFSEPPARDFGDAPDTSYSTTRASFGPSHIIGGPLLGMSVDAETDGLFNGTATGDGTDDDGVHFRQLFVPDSTVEVEVTSSAGGGMLDFFFDFDGDGVFGSDAHEVFHATLQGGRETLSVAVPADAATGITYARFRISSGGNLGPLGLAYDGEVEDYQILILPAPDLSCTALEYFDDAVAPALPADWSTASDQSVFWITSSAGSDSSPNSAFVADVSYVSQNILTSPSIPITSANSLLRFRNYYNLESGVSVGFDGGVLEISIGAGARMDILAAGGSFVAGGYNFTLSTLYDNPLSGRSAWSGDSGGYIDTIVQLPPDAAGQTVQFYWIEGTDASVSDDGWNIDTIQLCGETELSFDFGDAPDPAYPTLSANSGAAHLTGGSLFLGSLIDADADGQPVSTADGDDSAGDDDEDGVSFTSPLSPGAVATLDVIASADGLLNAWIDFNADEDWQDTGEQIFQDVAIHAGTNSLSFAVPATATANGSSYGRFRLSSQAGVTFSGLAPDGEVEDYLLEITAGNSPPAADAGGPYDVGQGGSVVLNGTNSTDPNQDAALLEYLWDLDNDGIFGETGDDAVQGDEVGVEPTFSAVGLIGETTVEVTLRVVDLGGLTDEAIAAVNLHGLNVEIEGSLAGYPVESFGSEDILPTTLVVEDNGGTLQMAGNTWKKLTFAYEVTPATVLEFDFQSSQQGEIHGIGFDTDDLPSSSQMFQLYGSESWGIQDFHDYSPIAGPQHYVIAVGEFFTGTMTRLVLVTDDDANALGQSLFSNIRIYEAEDLPIVLDSEDTVGVTLAGIWTDSATVPGYQGLAYKHDGNTGKGSKSVTFTPEIPVAGTYEVYLWWTEHTGRATNVPVDIHYSGGIETVTLNQRIDGSQWNLLGTFDFVAGSDGKVVIRTDRTNGFVIADAVRFVRTPDTSTPSADLSDPVHGATISGAVLNARGYLEVTFADEGGSGLDASSITDPAAEFVLSGAASAGVTVDGAASLVAGTESTYRYTFTGTFGDGNVAVDFLAGSWRDNADNSNIAESEAFSVSDVIQLDSGGTQGVTLVGIWYDSATVPGYQGLAYKHDGNTGKGTKSVTFTPDVPVAGIYEVYLWWTEHTGRATNVPVDIHYSGGTETVTLNQRIDGSQWNLLGTFEFEAGSDGNVVIRTDGTNGFVIADAVRFVRAADTSTPSADLSDPVHGATISGAVLNARGYLEVTFADEGGSGLDASSITDPAAEFVLTGAASAGVTVDGAASLVAGTESTYRYTFTGTFGDGNVAVDLLAGSWRDNADNSNIAESEAFSVSDVIQLDSGGTQGVTLVGIWYDSTTVPGYQGLAYKHDGNTGKGSKSVTFTPEIPVAGTYEVHLWWTEHTGRATNVPVDIHYSGGTQTVTLNQRIDGSQWNVLGTFEFEAGSDGNVVIRTDGTNGFVIADAVRFVRV